MNRIHSFRTRLSACLQRLVSLLASPVYFGRSLHRVPEPSLVFFPLREAMFCCGLAGIVAYKKRNRKRQSVDMALLEKQITRIEDRGFLSCRKKKQALGRHYLGGDTHVRSLLQAVRALKRNRLFYEIYHNLEMQGVLVNFASRLKDVVESEEKYLLDRMGRLKRSETEVMSSRIEDLKDIYWCLTAEIADSIQKIQALTAGMEPPVAEYTLEVFKQIDSLLNSIDRLEVRGRDSAGISIQFILTEKDCGRFEKILADLGLQDLLSERSRGDVLLNRMIRTRKQKAAKRVAVSFTYKIAAEIGSLGDNIRFIRDQIREDRIFQTIAKLPSCNHTILSHTRWASVGAITDANCHPVDNGVLESAGEQAGWIHVCLNGDIDNYQELKAAFEREGGRIPKDITTDTKIIPVQIEKHIRSGAEVAEAFRLAVNEFKGSHAIAMHTDLAPGKMFLAQRGSGQTIFVGIGEDLYMPTSEVYGLVEETDRYVKMDGDLIFHGKNGSTQGQIFILDQETGGGLDGLRAMFYDGTPIQFQEKDIKSTAITSRDIDRQGLPHYFLKEILEAPVSVEKTLQNRWKTAPADPQRYTISLGDRILPDALQTALKTRRIQRIYFIGQGTAGVAALACANILSYYLNDTTTRISALKASELSGFSLNDGDRNDSMADTLIVAISQSGTTTDTNRTVDMVKERGAWTIGIVNRRDSDLTFKVDGVMYTSSGRDIEMSVASTKAFYSQILAGALLSLSIAQLTGRRDEQFVSEELKQLTRIPAYMREILAKQREIETSARRLAATKTYWAAVGSGPNKASADEIRIKLSELCYKTISSDFVEDKKHIDLSSEPLIFVCAAGARDSVIGDIIKDTAIFRAHKAAPVVIANEGEHRFDPYADDVFHVPVVDEHLAPILNTLVGHIWGYYAALSIHEGSRVLYGFQQEVQQTIDDFAKKGLDIYEVLLEKTFREKIARFYQEFRSKKDSNPFPMAISLASDLTLLLKYLSGRLPVSDFELDFGKKGTALNMVNTLFECLAESINRMARPIDAIKHQAKTVTVGTSRISDRVEGILYDTLFDYHFSISQLTPSNVLVLRNLQGIISRINGSILYRIGQLNYLGELTEETTIEVAQKKGLLVSIPSRVEKDRALKGTKRIIVKEGNVYIGQGRKDGQSILIIPVISDNPSKPNMTEYLLLLNIAFRENVPLSVKTKALGGKYERIKSIVQESSIPWEDRHLERVETKELFGKSAEKIAEQIISQAG